MSPPPAPADTNLLVGYASAYGSTKGVANRIGECLRDSGFTVDVRPIDEVESVDGYDAMVIGSAIHNQQWLPPATAHLQTFTVASADRPVWLFSVCSVGETTSFLNDRVARTMRRARARREPAAVTKCRSSMQVRDHRYFAGAIERTHWTVAGNLFLRLCGGTYGDHRDWPDIEQWATGIANALKDGSATHPSG